MPRRRSSKNVWKKDPDSSREQERYTHPIPSRRAIQALLDSADAPLDFTTITQHFSLNSDRDFQALRKRLRAMRRDGQIIVGRRGAYGVPRRMDLHRCRIIGHRDGYGFARPYEGGNDLFLSAREMHQVFDEDEVLVAIAGVDRRGRNEGHIVEVLRRAHTELVGRYFEESGIGYLLPYNTRIRNHILIPSKTKGDAQNGQLVSIELTDYPSATLGARGKVKEILGDYLDPGLEIDLAIRTHGIPWDWPEKVLKEAAALGDEPTECDKAQRVDLRHMPFITIDGADARDFDDAVWCRQNDNGFQLMVAIADVSHYVPIDSSLDKEAQIRGTSVYFPEKVIPMFPEALSNGLCSLKPKVDRLALICDMQINSEGQLEGYTFFEAVIQSHARLTYDAVAKVIEAGKSRQVDSERVADINNLSSLFQRLYAARMRRGALEFDSQEIRILFDERQKISSIESISRNDAHRLIEECMLVANLATARFLESYDGPALFRVHAGPTADRLDNLRAFLGEFSLDLPGGRMPTAKDYQSLLSTVEGRHDAHVIEKMLLRSLSQAVYQSQNEGHFGLHYEAYTHFTSPIRRYPDLLTHRAIKSLIHSAVKSDRVRRFPATKLQKRKSIYPYDAPMIVALGEHCSMAERRADDATREVIAWLKCEFLKDRVGEEFSGVISAVTSFGIFVELANLYIEGLVHISTLPGDYYQFDQAKQRLVGERTRQIYQLGASHAVKVSRVDIDERKIDLELVSTPPRLRSSSKPNKTKVRKKQIGGLAKKAPRMGGGKS